MENGQTPSYSRLASYFGKQQFGVEVTFMAERRVSANGSWIDWVIDDCHESSIPYILRYFSGHQRRLEDLLEGYFVQSKSLTVRVSQRDAASWHLHAMLTLPSGVFVAEGRDETLLVAMDRVMDSLRADVKRHLRQTTGILPAASAPQQEFLSPLAGQTMLAMASG